MKKYLYDLIATSRKNDCTDLAVEAWPRMMYDARNGVRNYTDDCTDLAALHADYLTLEAARKDVMGFLGRHYDVLMEAYKSCDRAGFEQVIAECEAQDEAKKEEKEEAAQV